jgi:hypothetical protein
MLAVVVVTFKLEHFKADKEVLVVVVQVHQLAQDLEQQRC